MAQGSGSSERPLETGWLQDTPVGDSLLRRFVFNQACVNEAIAGSLGGRARRGADVFLTDSTTPVPYFNQAILARPVIDIGDPVLDEVDGWFEGIDRTVSMLSIWPTPDFGERGWTLVGHPMMVARAPQAHTHEPPADVSITVADTPDDFATAEQVAIEGYPIDEAAGLPTHSVLRPGIADSGMVVRIGRLDGVAVGVGLSFVAEGVLNLCLGATLAAARRRGVWEALVWARIGDAPDLPAVAYTSDYSRPGFERMGFLPISRFTLWAR